MGRPAHSKRGSKVQVALYLTPEEIDYLVSRATGGTTPSRALHALLKDAMRGTPVQEAKPQVQATSSQPVMQKKAQAEPGKVRFMCPDCIRKGAVHDFGCPTCKRLLAERRQ